MAAKLKPNFVLIATSVETPLFLFKIVNINSELLAGIKYRRLGATFSSHPGKIIEGSDFLDRTTAARDGVDQSRGVALDPNVGLGIPESNMLQGAAIFRFLSAVLAPPERF